MLILGQNIEFSSANKGLLVSTTQNNKPTQELESVVIRFAGDSGDGMQLTGNQFSDTSAALLIKSI